MEKKVLMTKYFYPIEKGGTKKFFGGIYFDNPRTKEEIEYIRSLLKEMNKECKFPEEKPRYKEFPITIKWAIEKFCEFNKDKKTVRDYCNDISEDNDLYLSLAKMWVVIRCNKILNASDIDQYCQFEELKKDEDCFNNVVNFERIRKLMLFLSFMVKDKYDTNKSILVNDTYGMKGILHEHSFSEFIYGNYTLEDFENNNTTFDHFSGTLNVYNKYIELIGNKYTDEKFLFICDTIENITELGVKSPKMYMLSIVGLIEMLLTHNPDKSTYNIEDSITKQYVRKLKYVLYKNDNKIDIGELEKELKLSYQIRSDIAHGNFGKESKKNIEKLYEIYKYNIKAKGEDYISQDCVIDHLNMKLTMYVHILLEMYLRDSIELDLLKDL